MIAPGFGPRSARRHLDLARRAGVAVCLVRLPTLAFDVDTPDDLARLRRSRPEGETGGCWPRYSERRDAGEVWRAAE